MPLPPSAPSAFPAVQYLSQPQPQPYAVHGHFQPTQTGEAAPAPVLAPSIHQASLSRALLRLHMSPSPPRLPPAWRCPVLTEADGTRQPADRFLRLCEYGVLGGQGQHSAKGRPQAASGPDSLLHSPPCAPCTPKLCIQPRDSLPLPSSLCRCNRQGR